ncbi:flagellar basal body L-ring protein FlgH [Aquabacterium sp. A7-Y]|uniref:flagellar basal body L-ring protein FlgH n=1 Tax=Aquabacterium sp. A7-Y TaxID=1349605 RepID=UPI00223CD126|nr:flagellar basal body L-ring protein FlgH [Aquabacterium sp. A7-Y]MCW7540880.1 flagellar basal body L-ring protein FlgH [Aquabacterium sp. A7-Y]
MNCLRAATVALALVGAAPVLANEGQSLYDPKTYRPLVADQKAFKVGDLLTVVIQEQASASTTADSTAGRSTGVSAQIDPFKAAGRSASANLGTESDGGGRTQRSGRLLAQLTVNVVGVEPDGDLIVYGRQDLTINGESQLITLRGRVRPKDVSDGNLVPSTRVADADIRFDGEGFIAEKSRPGWFTKLLSLFGL